MNNLTAYTVKNIKGKKKQPAWLRTVLRSDDGILFIPAILAGNEHPAFLCAIFDGIPYSMFKNHVFLPATWLKKEYPVMEELVGVLENRTWV